MQYLLEEEYKRQNAHKEKAIEMARAMKRNNEPIEKIAEYTGLKKTSIHNLKID